jgi:DNA-directed RNA polymerase subunit alpha
MLNANWRGLVRPKGVDIEELGDSYGKFVVKPLERGFGITVGNSLRRIALSSIRGAAVYAVKFEGISHEFSTIPGVVEDVADIILNLKQLKLKLNSDESKIIRLDVTRAGAVKASDIQTDDSVEILNPDLHIATLNDQATLKCEFFVKFGRGYVPVELCDKDDLPIGAIAIDAVYSPITRVNYTVTQARVGHMTNFDKLTLEMWTNGSIKPDDAIAVSSKILKEQLNLFINFEEQEEVYEEVKIEQREAFNPNLLKSVDELELSVRSANCLQNANIASIAELVTKTESEMLKTKNFGRKSLNEIKEILTEMGLGLGLKLDHIPELQPYLNKVKGAMPQADEMVDSVDAGASLDDEATDIVIDEIDEE